MSTMEVTVVPCLSDNYAYVVRCKKTNQVAVVDPSEFEPVRVALQHVGGTLSAVFCTHHHWDHVGGVEELLAAFGADLPVYGHSYDHDRIPRISRQLAHEDRFSLGALGVRALAIPGHTLGALAYVIDNEAAFTGDTLFVAGCGRLFEGTPAMMDQSLNTVLGTLGDSVAVYPGHEYAEKNLRFAAMVEGGSRAVSERLASVQARRARNKQCVPSTMGEERATNPFLRVRTEAVMAWAAGRGADPNDPVAVLGAVRAARNEF